MTANSSIDVAATGQSAVELVQRADESLTVVAPFIKVATLRQLLTDLAPSTRLRVISRWHLSELVAGVSDLDVWPLIRDRGGELKLVPSLHTKAFLTPSEVLVGSANVTAAALGWSSRPNYELLVHPVSSEGPLVRSNVEHLWTVGIAVTDALYEQFRTQLDQFEPPPIEDDVAVGDVTLPDLWLPTSRDPADIERFFVDGETALGTSAALNAQLDLAQLDVETIFDAAQLRGHIYLSLLQHPLVTDLRGLLTERRRFGEVSRHIGRVANLERDEANTAWQTLMRWLLYFQPGDWEYEKPRHSEILRYTGPANLLAADSFPT